MKICNIALIGRPNTGKSTLLNNIIGYDLSIITNTPQTTRDQIRGIYTDDEYQLIFIDTPGIHKANHLLNEKLNKSSYDSLEEADLILFLQPINEEIGRGDKFIIEKLKDFDNKIAVITKMDLGEIEAANQKASELKNLGFNTVVGVGLTLNQTYEDLISIIKHEYADKLEENEEPFYDPELITDVSMRFIAKETIRETAINYLKEELPHSIAVVVDDFEENEDAPYVIRATIFVKRESQKGIVVGKGGSMIKKISMNSRHKIANQFQHPIVLELRVKVNQDWVDDEKQIKKMGY
ncbi:GTPase Era [[Mycoplasma] gypis]|uniref:GTPase Era n=1 Tax=[Mycoplasma] gypis TaxID=92404 RepID=A0ABZ2RMA0_9BACT|nr:GTPase Era [[Mycoplasma] gypis]MBN0919129.1 GTPase Era [[Mycoplasma] gypis]